MSNINYFNGLFSPSIIYKYLQWSGRARTAWRTAELACCLASAALPIPMFCFFFHRTRVPFRCPFPLFILIFYVFKTPSRILSLLYYNRQSDPPAIYPGNVKFWVASRRHDLLIYENEWRQTLPFGQLYFWLYREPTNADAFEFKHPFILSCNPSTTSASIPLREWAGGHSSGYLLWPAARPGVYIFWAL